VLSLTSIPSIRLHAELELQPSVVPWLQRLIWKALQFFRCPSTTRNLLKPEVNCRIHISAPLDVILCQ
jgi:hypothetical protein